jgi:hypothetical protein
LKVAHHHRIGDAARPPCLCSKRYSKHS